MSEELKPCPFCGGEAKPCWHDGFPSVGCTKCSANTGISIEGSLVQVLDAWNTRQSAQAQTLAVLEQAREALRAIIRSTSASPVGGGDGQTFVVTPPSGEALRVAGKALTTLTAKIEEIRNGQGC